MKSLFITLALLASVQAAAQRSPAASERFTWQGAVTGVPLTPDSPLAPIPQVDGARRLLLPTPEGPLPKGVAIPFGEGGGPITLLAPWRGGWVVGTNAGEWGGALYIVMPDKRVVIARGNVIGGFSWRGRLYILSGLRHLTLDDGELWEVDLRASRLVRRISLPAMPTDVIVSKEDGLVIRTRAGDVIVSASGEVTAGGR